MFICLKTHKFIVPILQCNICTYYLTSRILYGSYISRTTRKTEKRIRFIGVDCLEAPFVVVVMIVVACAFIVVLSLVGLVSGHNKLIFKIEENQCQLFKTAKNNGQNLHFLRSTKYAKTLLQQFSLHQTTCRSKSYMRIFYVTDEAN